MKKSIIFALAAPLMLAACGTSTSTGPNIDPEQALRSCSETDAALYYCYAQVAADALDPSICERAPSPEDTRKCYEKTAYISQNPDTCRKARGMSICEKNINIEGERGSWKLAEEGENNYRYEGSGPVKVFFSKKESSVLDEYYRFDVLNDESYALPPRVYGFHNIELDGELPDGILDSTSDKPVELEINSIEVTGSEIKFTLAS